MSEYSVHMDIVLCFNVLLKANEFHGFNSCIVIHVYSLDIPLIEKAAENR